MDSMRPSILLPTTPSPSHVSYLFYIILALRAAPLENRLEPITGRGSICQNVLWRPLSKGAKHLISRILPGADNIPNGQFAKSAVNIYCFRVPFKISTLLQSKKEYSKVSCFSFFHCVSLFYHLLSLFLFSMKINKNPVLKAIPTKQRL